MKPEENIEKKLYIPPDFYVLDFEETKGGEDYPDFEDHEGGFSTGGA